MKRNPLKTLLLVIAVSFSACLQSLESSFFRSFSLRKLVTEKRSYAGLECKSLGGGGGGGGTDGIWSLRATREFHSNKTETYVCAIKANSADLDETALMEEQAKKAGKTKMEFHYFPGLDHSLNISDYFIKGTVISILKLEIFKNNTMMANTKQIMVHNPAKGTPATKNPSAAIDD